MKSIEIFIFNPYGYSYQRNFTKEVVGFPQATHSHVVRGYIRLHCHRKTKNREMSKEDSVWHNF
jgi:hypothetical protein